MTRWRGDQRDHPREDADADAPRRGGLVSLAGGIEKARPRDHVQLRIGVQALEQVVHVARIVLSVAVDLHRHVVAALARVDVAALHGPPDAQVEGHAQHGGARPHGALGGGVARAVVDHHHVEVRRPAVDRLDRRGDRAYLVVRWNDGEIAAHDGLVWRAAPARCPFPGALRRGICGRRALHQGIG